MLNLYPQELKKAMRVPITRVHEQKVGAVSLQQPLRHSLNQAQKQSELCRKNREYRREPVLIYFSYQMMTV